MLSFHPPLRDIAFVMHELLDADALIGALPGGDAWDRATIAQTLEAAGRFAVQELLPLNATGDREGCACSADGVRLPSGFADTYRRYVEAGWPTLGCVGRLGGQGAPSIVQMAMFELFNGANPAWSMIPGAVRGAYRLLLAHGSAEQQAHYLTRIVSGEWTATMAITEPHCGSDLSLIRTRAEAAADGSFRIHGAKLFITGGDHDMAPNIVHLVLARLPDAPPGVAGISLFLVPKFLSEGNGLAATRNGMHATAVEHKMGLNGSPTCAMSFEGSTGWLVGQPNEGLRNMFVMINSARVAIGAQVAGMGQAAFDSSLAYARERLQMRAASGTRRPDLVADPIAVHADVRRMLLTQRAHVEAARMFVSWMALELDCEAAHPDAARRREAADTVALLTPVCKAFLAENGTTVAQLAIQVYGGHGYVRDNGVEQIVRDVRVAQIYDGTTAIQARDLLGRKILPDGGRALGRYVATVRAEAGAGMAPEFAAPLNALCDEVERLTAVVAEAASGNADVVGAIGCDYLRVIGHLVCGQLFARAATRARRQIDAGTTDPFYAAKCATARFYFARLLPEAHHHAALARTGVAGLSMECDGAQLFA
ncbi:acyl-CoA dehydrogenase C-terminal domain-containing protein [Variovorax ginsengisoli]|uniref:Alkylation response protein AidB-like acyl-CoA dehydrogenase n=1 Tax=Variovorax ginsengisoli TaxID=363844 RepID=A0ABT9S9V6_9BURK|nr:acyl-CoA dehydrogenase C-terminal domain-containing protein [Variovorax ginsengisoli]MDP9900995.1 alkylation response protein AidB-like acyl-CoA dehydrogenase [Variovorax ginsengisoli]